MKAARRFYLSSRPSQGRVTAWFRWHGLSGAARRLAHRRGLRSRATFWDLVARPWKAARRFFSVLRPSQGRAPVWFRWCSLSRPRVDSVCRRGPFRPRDAVVFGRCGLRTTRQFGFVGAASEGHASILLVIAAFTGPRDSLPSLARAFEAARQFCSLPRSFRAARHGRWSPWPSEPHGISDLLARPLKAMHQFYLSLRPSQGHVTVWFVSCFSLRSFQAAQRCRLAVAAFGAAWLCRFVGTTFDSRASRNVDFPRCRGLNKAARQPDFIGATSRGRASIGSSSWPFELRDSLGFFGVALEGRASLLLVVAAFTGPRDCSVSLVRPFEAAHPFCSSSRSFRAARRCRFLVVAAFGAAQQFGFVGAACDGHASILLIVAAFTGPCDSLVSLARPLGAARRFAGRHGLLGPRDAVILSSRPSGAARQRGFVGATFQGLALPLFVVALFLDHATLLFVVAAFRNRAAVWICWRSLWRPCVDFPRRCGLHWAARQFGSAGTALQGRMLTLSVAAVLSGRVTLLFCRCGLSEPRDSLGFGGAAFDGRALILLVVAAFTGPRDCLASSARPFEAARQFGSSSRSFWAARRCRFVVAAFRSRAPV